MRMRERLLPLVLVAIGCFSEPVTNAGECVGGRPGCDCRAGQQCDEGSECVSSIDKCVPVECTPGAATCTCIDVGAGMCSGALECRGGVCLEPGTGSDGGVASSTGDPGTSSTTNGSSTSLSTTDVPPVTETLGSSTSIDVTGVLESSSSGSAPIDCLDCLQNAAVDSCADEFDTCTANERVGGCSTLAQCVLEETGTITECCEQNDGSSSHLHWNAFALCADANACQAMCLWACPV
jgi:hypothetical protein